MSVNLYDSSPKPQAMMWHFPSYFKDMTREEWKEYTRLNEQHLSNPNLFLEAEEGHIKGRIMSSVAAYKRKTISQYQEPNESLRRAQSSYTQSPLLVNKRRWKVSKNACDLCLARYERMKENYSKLRYDRYGNKAGKLLSHLIKGTHKLICISSIHDATGNLVT